MKKPNIKIILFDTYMSRIKNSVDSKIFQNLYAKYNNIKRDILDGGDLSCAMFVSSILFWCKIIGDIHTTVTSTVKDMEKSGWYKIKNKKIGAVLVWEPEEFSDGLHAHIGFYIGNNQAISNSSIYKVPKVHHYATSNNRKIIAIYWNKKLDK